ncbi:hypothetical protein WR25_04222 [Diploscapter pachys]|uniref:Uncharacterized protein n=1 Tax=Diploscapter pachys TaxID=2018661 RepID=A0A2A2K1E1_9BILA|nr:hypothetical protein WR25_04222 [Diploscapter pachys]
MRGEVTDLSVEIADEGLAAEKQQEQMLMNKLASSGRLPAKPATSFIQKKLQQRKFFDSGDYAMDRSKGGVTGAAAPAAARPPNPLAATPQIKQTTDRPTIANEPSSPECENLQIPRPDTVPQRKASIINPAVHCKLSPAPHVQHHDHVPPATEHDE